MYQRTVTVALVLLAIVFMLNGCKNRVGSQAEVKEINLYLPAEPLSMDPRVGGDTNSQLVLRELFEGLTRYGKANEPELALAESVCLSEDKATYTFHLRPSQWSNGSPVTSKDFEYAWKTIISSPLSSKYAYAFFVIKNALKASRGQCSVDEVGIFCPDDSTLQVTLEHPAPYFLQWTANPIYSPVCQAMVEKDSAWAGKSVPNYVSNGPYLVKEHTLKSHIILEKNPQYWNFESVKNDKLSFSIIEDPTTAYNLYQAGKVDWYGAPLNATLPPEMIARLIEDNALQTYHGGVVLRVDCCAEKRPLSSAKIRKAIAQSINRKELVSHFYCGDTPASSIVPERFSLLPSPSFEDGDGVGARKLFEEGIGELGMTKETYPPLNLYADTRYSALAEVLAQQIHAALGITVVPKIYEIATLYQKCDANEHDLVIQAWYTWLQDPIYNLDSFKFKNNFMTYTAWQSDEYVRLLDASDNMPDVEERKNLLAAAETLIMKELVTIPLFNVTRKYTNPPYMIGECYSKASGVPELKGLEKQPA